MRKIHALMIMSLLLLPSCKKGSDVSEIPEAPLDMIYPAHMGEMTDLNDEWHTEYCKARFPDYKTMETYVRNDFPDRTKKQYCAMDFDSPKHSKTHYSQHRLLMSQILDGGAPADYHFYSEEIDYVDLAPMYRTDKFEGKQNAWIQFISEPIKNKSIIFPNQIHIFVKETNHEDYTVEYEGEISVRSNEISLINPENDIYDLAGYIYCKFFNVQSDSAKEYIKSHLMERFTWMNLLPSENISKS